CTASPRRRRRWPAGSSPSSTSPASCRCTSSASTCEADMSPPPRSRARRRACAVALALASAVPGLRAQDEAAPGRDAVSIEARPGYLEAVQRIAGGDERGGVRTLEEI